MTISELGIVEANASIYPVTDYSNEKKALYPVDEVLYMWMDTIDVASDELARIKSIELGYDIALDELTQDAAIKAVPHYRVIMHDGNIYEIAAYTNQLRKEVF
jgi:hypothetical protein